MQGGAGYRVCVARGLIVASSLASSSCYMTAEMSTEAMIEAFWNSHPCGDNLLPSNREDYLEFFSRYDALRYALEGHILKRLDEIDFHDKATLEIGLGQGADSQQIIQRGAKWSGLDLTQESIDRVHARLSLRKLPYVELKKGSVLDIPYGDESFDIVYSHGVLHHVPEIHAAQREIARVLRPNGTLVVMVYAKYSLNYLLSISVVRRLGLLALLLPGLKPRGIYAAHVEQARAMGIRRYLRMNEFIHHNTDGPENPYSKVYTRRELKRDFPDFRITRVFHEFMHAPPLPVNGLPGARCLGWHLWAHLVKR